MSSADDKLLSRSGSVEVVADQAQDGSFEIRVARDEAGAAAASAAPTEDESSSSWQAVEGEGRVAKRSPLFIGGIILGVTFVVVALGAWLLRTPGPSSRPETVAVRAAPEFRGFVIAGQAPARARSVQLNFPTNDAPEPSQDWDAPMAGSAPFEANSGGIQTRGAAVNAQTPSFGNAQARELTTEERRAEALEELRNAIETERARRAEERSMREEATAVGAPQEEEPEEEAYDEEYVEDDEAYDEYEE